MAAFSADLLIPKPQQMTRRIGQFELRELKGLALAGWAGETDEAGYLAEEAGEVAGRKLRAAPATAAGILRLERTAEEAVGGRGAESYTLTIGADGIRIVSSSARGLFYGLQTLRQIMAVAGTRLPALRIADWPTLPFRGYSDDISRKQVSTLADLFFIVRQLARFKMNVYCPYMEDMILIDAEPMLGINRGRLTRDEVASLVAFGRRHFVDIVPQFNSSAHCENMLNQKEYHGLRFENNPETLDPRNPAARRFLERVYAQLFTQFPSRYFHMGLDEARGLGERPDLYVRHCNWLAQMVLAHGRRPIMWHDMFVPYHAHFTKYSAKNLDRLDRRIILDQWVYEEHWQFLPEMTRRGFQMLISPSVHGCPAETNRRAFHLNSEFTRFALRTAPASQPGAAARDVEPGSILGMLNTSWNHDGLFDRQLHHRGLGQTGLVTWTGPLADAYYPKFNRAFDIHFYGLNDAKLSGAMTAVIEGAAEAAALVNLAHMAPVQLAQKYGRDGQALKRARKALEALARQRAVVAKYQAEARHNAAHLDHIAHSLEQIGVGACRVLNSPALLAALKARNPAIVGRILTLERKALQAVRSRTSELWLRRHKLEGFEYRDHHYRQALSAMENLPFHMAHDLDRYVQLTGEGFTPVDLGASANGGPDALVALPFGPIVLDNTPWLVADPAEHGSKSLVWTRSRFRPKNAKCVAIPVNRPAQGLHFLHAVLGRDTERAGSYRVVYANGQTQTIELCPGKDAADWWMPFGHLFGGGGALRIDPRRARLAFLTSTDYLQGHCLYHFWVRTSQPTVTIKRLEVLSGSSEASLVLAAFTLANTRPGPIR